MSQSSVREHRMPWGALVLERPARQPDHNCSGPGHVSNEMSHWKCQRGRIRRAPPGLSGRTRTLDEERRDESQSDHERRTPQRSVHGSEQCRENESGQREQHRRCVEHHHRSRHIVAGEAPGMPRDDINPAVAYAELLPEISAKPLAPAMNADRRPAERKSMAAGVKAVTEVVVVAVPEARVQQPDLMQRTRAIGGVAGADVIDEGSVDLRVPMLEIATHGPRPEAGAGRGDIVTLDGGNL